MLHDDSQLASKVRHGPQADQFAFVGIGGRTIHRSRWIWYISSGARSPLPKSGTATAAVSEPDARSTKIVSNAMRDLVLTALGGVAGGRGCHRSRRTRHFRRWRELNEESRQRLLDLDRLEASEAR